MTPTEQFIEMFVLKERQDRYLALASKPSRREDFVWSLAHDGRHLDRRFMRQLPTTQSASDAIALLQSHKVGTRCFVVAALYEEFDNSEFDTNKVLSSVIGTSNDCIVFFPTACMAYYENHEGERYILQRPT